MRRLRGSQLAIVAFGAAPTVMRRRNALELETPDATATPLYAYATHDQSEISLSPTALPMINAICWLWVGMATRGSAR